MSLNMVLRDAVEPGMFLVYLKNCAKKHQQKKEHYSSALKGLNSTIGLCQEPIKWSVHLH